MSVYVKLNEAREKFHALKLEKTGHNKFAGYNYFELGDFLIPALRVFNEVGLCAIVSFDKEMSRMFIVDIDAAYDDPTARLVIESPMGSAALKGCHEVQNIGAVETYQRRYLWVAALEIVEHDALDATTGKAEKAKGTPLNHQASGPALAFESLQPEEQDRVRKISARVVAAMPSASTAIDIIDSEDLDADHKAGLWHLLDSGTRSAIKRAQEAQKEAA